MIFFALSQVPLVSLVLSPKMENPVNKSRVQIDQETIGAPYDPLKDLKYRAKVIDETLRPST